MKHRDWIQDWPIPTSQTKVVFFLKLTCFCVFLFRIESCILNYQAVFFEKSKYRAYRSVQKTVCLQKIGGKNRVYLRCRSAKVVWLYQKCRLKQRNEKSWPSGTVLSSYWCKQIVSWGCFISANGCTSWYQSYAQL